jgi:hypothetical protein
MSINAAKKKTKRVYTAFGSLDKKTRRWQYLPRTYLPTNQLPRGEELVYNVNSTTLEIGQGMSGLRGYVGIPILTAVVMLIVVLIYASSGFYDAVSTDFVDLKRWYEYEDILSIVFFAFAAVFFLFVGLPLCFLAGVLGFNDVFGYIDAPVRFDRIHRKVYVWASRKEGPLELDWDKLKVVAQSASAPPYQVNSFQSVLLVDEDADGEVQFEGRIPRIAQIGAAVLNKEHTIAAYEFVRTFMERGPDALPSVKEYLVMRPRGIRSFVDIFGILKGFMRNYPSLPKDQRYIGLRLFCIGWITLSSFVLLPIQLAQGIALKFTTRVPKWPQKYQILASVGGEMLPPKGAVPNDPALLTHEKWIAAFWVISAVSVNLWMYFR